MDVGVTHFETEAVRFTLLDAPGHRCAGALLSAQLTQLQLLTAEEPDAQLT